MKTRKIQDLSLSLVSYNTVIAGVGDQRCGHGVNTKAALRAQCLSERSLITLLRTISLSQATVQYSLFHQLPENKVILSFYFVTLETTTQNGSRPLFSPNLPTTKHIKRVLRSAIWDLGGGSQKSSHPVCSASPSPTNRAILSGFTRACHKHHHQHNCCLHLLHFHHHR